jgi:hypothetical protein
LPGWSERLTDTPLTGGEAPCTKALAAVQFKGEEMTRNLKVLGLALVTMCALGAMTVSVASAQGKLTTGSKAAVTLTGLNMSPFVTGQNAFTAFGEKTECPAAHYTGHKASATPHIAIPNGLTEATITPHYGKCTTYSSGGNFPSTVDMNGCDYRFQLGGLVGGIEGTYAVDAFVFCPKNTHIQVTQFIDSGHSFRSCTVTIIHKGTAYTGLHATNAFGGHIRIHSTIEGIVATKSGVCGHEEDKNAKLHLNVTVKATNGDEISISS